MPSYTFRCVEDDSEYTLFMSNVERLQYLIDNPDVSQIFSPTAQVTSRSGKPDQGFRDILRSVKRRHRRSTVNTF